MILALDRLERRVMEMLLAGDDPVLCVLREQYRGIEVVSRKLTGVGFYVTFAVDPQAVRVTDCSSRLVLSDVKADGAGLPYGAGFALFIDHGLIHFLEGFTFEGPWPDQPDDLQLSYDGDEAGRVRRLREKWSPLGDSPSSVDGPQ